MSRWIYLVALGLVGLLGLYVAADARTEGGYVLGLVLTLFCVLLGFHIIRQIVDGGEIAVRAVIPRQAGSGRAMVVVMSLICLGAIYLAASGDPYLYYGGLGIAAASFVLALIGVRVAIDGATGQDDRH